MILISFNISKGVENTGLFLKILILRKLFKALVKSFGIVLKEELCIKLEM